MAAAIPDGIESLEARGLLHRRGSLHLPSTAAGSGFVLAPVHGLAAAYGAPSAGELEELGGVAAEAGLEALELHAPVAAGLGWARRGLVDFTGRAGLSVLPFEREAHMGRDLQHETVLLEGPEDPFTEGLPRALLAELRGLRPWTSAAVALAGDVAVSLAYAFVEDGGWMDVSIDTLPDFRRSGFAAAAAATLIRHRLDAGVRPVWGADPNNRASIALAQRLGFERAMGVTMLRLTTPRG